MAAPGARSTALSLLRGTAIPSRHNRKQPGYLLASGGKRLSGIFIPVSW